MPGDRKSGQIQHRYDVMFVFTGRYWMVPRDSEEEAVGWGDVWDIRRFGHEIINFPSALPFEVAYRCVVLGEGVVLDPFAGSGTTVFAAIRAGRSWLACDSNPEHRSLFERRRALVEQYGADLLW